jgi:hypothetical protein
MSKRRQPVEAYTNVDELFRRADELGYDQRRRILSRGEAAQLADPVESPLWYVDYPESIVEAAQADIVGLRELAADVIRWSEGIIDPTSTSEGHIDPSSTATPREES